MFISTDSGYGGDKFAYFKGDEIIFGKSLSVYSEAPDNASDMPLFEGKRYYTGEEALMEDSDNIINIIDYKGHEKFIPLSIYSILNTIGVNSEQISFLGISLSLAQKEYSKNFLKRATKFKINKVDYDFTSKIKLLPQGVGAKYAIDHYYYKDNHNETYAIIDIGQLTIDIVNVLNGRVRSENADGISHEGVIKIIQKIQEYIAKEYKNFISIKEAQEVLLTKKFNLFGLHDLSDKIEEFKKEYTAYLMSILNQKYKNIFKKYPRIFFVGGGAHYIDIDFIKEVTHHEDVIIPENPEYYNAIGGLLFISKEEKI